MPKIKSLSSSPNGGYTLLEMMVVLVIITLLMSVTIKMVPDLTRSKGRTQALLDLSNAVALARNTAIMKHCNTYLVFYPVMEAGTSPSDYTLSAWTIISLKNFALGDSQYEYLKRWTPFPDKIYLAMDEVSENILENTHLVTKALPFRAPGISEDDYELPCIMFYPDGSIDSPIVDGSSINAVIRLKEARTVDLAIKNQWMSPENMIYRLEVNRFTGRGQIYRP